MIAIKQMDLRANIKNYFDLAFNGETIVVSRKENKNVVVISNRNIMNFKEQSVMQNI